MFDLGNGIDMSAVKSKRFTQVMEFYNRIGFFNRFPHFTVNGFPIYFDITKKRIGINLSSGADSTLLAYLLCEAIKKADCDIKIFPITFARHWEHNKWNEDAKTAVYEDLAERYPQIIQPQLWTMLPTAYEFTPVSMLMFNDDYTKPRELIEMDAKIELFHFMEYNNWAARHYELGVMYNGSNVVPEVELSSMPVHRKHETLTAGDQLEVVAPIEKFGANFVQANPFGLIEKDWVIAHYDYFGITDLLEKTVSCEATLHGCGACFHCDERAWAIKNNNRILDAL